MTGAFSIGANGKRNVTELDILNLKKDRFFKVFMSKFALVDIVSKAYYNFDFLFQSDWQLLNGKWNLAERRSRTE